MTVQFRRGYRLEVGTFSVETDGTKHALDISFSVDRDSGINPNSAEIVIFGLSRRHIAEVLAGSGTVVRLQVGYGKDIHEIFYGELIHAEEVAQGPDWLIRISSGDGESKIVTSRTAKSFAKGTLIADVLKQLVADLGVKSGNLADYSPKLLKGGTVLTRPFAVTGGASQAIQQICSSCGLSWSVQSGALQITDVGKPVKNQQYVPLISPATGLIGSPRFEKKGELTFQVLMTPHIFPGNQVVVESQYVSGAYTLTATRHFGDSSGNEWYIDCKAKKY